MNETVKTKTEFEMPMQEVETPFLAVCMSKEQARRRVQRMEEERKRRRKSQTVRLLMLECGILAVTLSLWTWALLRIL